MGFIFLDSFWFVPIIITILVIWEFLTHALADSFLLEFEWQQVSSSLRDFS